MQTVEQFWSWFLQLEEEISREGLQEESIKLLGTQLMNLDVPRWEIGRFDADRSKHYLALSGSNLLEVGQANREKILQMEAPATWVLLPFRPPKRWNRQFRLKQGGVLIDANHWLFEVHKFDDGLFDLVLCSDIREVSSAADKREAVIAALDNELGEAGMIEKINAVELRENLDVFNREGLIPIQGLKEIVLAEVRKR